MTPTIEYVECDGEQRNANGYSYCTQCPWRAPHQTSEGSKRRHYRVIAGDTERLAAVEAVLRDFGPGWHMTGLYNAVKQALAIPAVAEARCDCGHPASQHEDGRRECVDCSCVRFVAPPAAPDREKALRLAFDLLAASNPSGIADIQRWYSAKLEFLHLYTDIAAAREEKR